MELISTDNSKSMPYKNEVSPKLQAKEIMARVNLLVFSSRFKKRRRIHPGIMNNNTAEILNLIKSTITRFESKRFKNTKNIETEIKKKSI